MQSNDLVTAFRSPKTPGCRRRRPHVPSSKSTMSKNHRQNLADNQPSPFFHPGNWMSVYLGDQPRAKRSKPPAPRRWSRIYGDTNNPSTPILHFYGNHKIVTSNQCFKQDGRALSCIFTAQPRQNHTRITPHNAFGRQGPRHIATAIPSGWLLLWWDRYISEAAVRTPAVMCH